jgi:hypothetical protein
MEIEWQQKRIERLQQDLTDSVVDAALRLLINHRLRVDDIASDISNPMLETLIRKLQRLVRQRMDLPTQPAITDQTGVTNQTEDGEETQSH